jgi:hypothetical protein
VVNRIVSLTRPRVAAILGRQPIALRAGRPKGVGFFSKAVDVA